MSEPSPHTGGVVPPYLHQHWQDLRRHLHNAGELAGRTATMVTLEDVRPMLGLALMELTDATFSMYCLERDTVEEALPGVDE